MSGQDGLTTYPVSPSGRNCDQGRKRQAELAYLFRNAKAGLVYVTAFPNRMIMGRYLAEIAWETEVWVADAPSHVIHFNGERFLGPYGS